MGAVPGNIARYLNNERIRRLISRRCQRFLAVGATGAEGLIEELRHRFNGIVELRAPILMLILRIFPICKLMCFWSAVNRGANTQVKQTYILSDLLPTWGTD